MVTRRRFVLAGGGVVMLPALAGCLEDGTESDDDGTDTEDPDGDNDDRDDTNREGDDGGDAGDRDEADGDDQEEHTFGVDQFVYTTERVRRYGEFTEQPEETYRESEMVWMYIELANVTPVAEGPHLDTTWEFVAPDGEVLGSTNESIRIPAEPESLPNETFVTQGVEPSVFDLDSSGEYTNNVSITDLGSGETVELSKPVTVRRFEIESVVFTDGEPEDFAEQEAKADATYAAGEEVWFYVDVGNAPTDDSGKAVLDYTFEVETPDGTTWDPIQRTERWNRVEKDDILQYATALHTYEDDQSGTYELSITVEDKVDGLETGTTATFALD